MRVLRGTVEISKRFLYANDSFKVGILGVPFDKGQAKEGVGNGPAVIRNMGLLDQLTEIGKYLFKG